MGRRAHFLEGQLDMFRTAHDLMHNTQHGDGPGAMPYKRRTNKMPRNWLDGRSMNEDVAARGVTEPVRLFHDGGIDHLRDGHHRTAAAYDTNPQSLVPIHHAHSDRRFPR